MTLPRTTQSVSLPPPYKGMNVRDPLAVLGAEDSPWLLNVTQQNGYMALRGGIQVHGYASGDLFLNGTAIYPKDTGDKIFGFVATSGNRKIYEFTSGGAATMVQDLGTSSPDIAYPVLFNNNLLFFTEFVTMYRYDGTSWTSFAYTGVSHRSGTPYKGRMYLCGSSSTSYGYSSVGQLTGAVTAVDLSTVFDCNAGIQWIAPISLADSQQADQVLAFGSASGDVAIYSGDYPGAANWTLRSLYRIGKPLGVNNWIPVNGDSLVITSTGLVSLRALFTTGAIAATTQSVSAKIDKYWTRIVSNQTTPFNPGDVHTWSGVFWSEQNKILIGTNGYLDEAGTWYANKATILEYDLLQESWTVHATVSQDCRLNNLVKANGKIYAGLFYTDILQNNPFVVELFKAGTYKDEQISSRGSYISIPFAIVGGPTTFSGQGAIKKLNAVEPLLRTDAYSGGVSTYKIRSVVDFGRSQTAEQTIAAASGYTKAFASIGAEGTFFQYKISGQSVTSQTQGLELYAVNAFYEPGGIR